MATGPGYDPVRKEYGALASKYDRKWAGYVESTILETLRRCRELIKYAGFQTIDIDNYKITWLWGLMTATAAKAKSG